MRTLAVLALFVSFAAHAEPVPTFQSPFGKTEVCDALPHLPGGEYDEDDALDEADMCKIDFYDTTGIAVCPKTWSTSPGTMIYDISESGKSQREYEAQASCGGSKSGHKKLARFKQSMNMDGTSGTFSRSSMLYYHFSRYLNTTVNVPVAVMRTFDKDAHWERVSKKAHTKNMGKSAMNRAGWKWMYNVEKTPTNYRPIDELFTADRQQIFGALLEGGGERYGEEFNGIRSAWGVAQNNDFQKTPAFLAIRSSKPFAQAIEEGLSQGLRDSKIARAMGARPSELQMGSWMKELTEITLLDYIFNQQDRIGNIDFKWYAYSIMEDGGVKTKRVKSDLQRASMSRINFEKRGVRTELIQRTQLVDNDAGGRLYRNFTKDTQMLQKIRHIHTDTYRRLMALNRDLQSSGPVYQILNEKFGLTANQLLIIVKNTKEAATIYRDACANNTLQFDLLTPKQIMRGDEPEAKPADCNNP